MVSAENIQDGFRVPVGRGRDFLFISQTLVGRIHCPVTAGLNICCVWWCMCRSIGISTVSSKSSAAKSRWSDGIAQPGLSGRSEPRNPATGTAPKANEMAAKGTHSSREPSDAILGGACSVSTVVGQ